ncbi:MAG: DUF3574 domain-containing protein, partial [Planctomycetota bacterium]|nr:DUF3574 domain-containing protein [Planctomycetota bacterium]
GGCVSSKAAPAPTWQTSTVYFGRNIGATEGVSDEDWTGFLKASVTPEFPKGLTVLDGLGQYRDESKELIRERSKILILVHPIDEKSRAKVKAIIDRYKSQFKQESVLWVEAPSKVKFR